MPEAAMSERYSQRLDELLARALGFNSIAQSHEHARLELDAALPEEIDLGWPKVAVVDAALAAIERYGEQGGPDPTGVLSDVAYWRTCRGRPTQVPAWVEAEVRRRFARPKALAVLRGAFERATEQTGKGWLVAEDLQKTEGRAIEHVRELMEWPHDGNKSLGRLLALFELKAGERGSGTKRWRRNSEGVRWEFIEIP